MFLKNKSKQTTLQKKIELSSNKRTNIFLDEPLLYLFFLLKNSPASKPTTIKIANVSSNFACLLFCVEKTFDSINQIIKAFVSN